MSEQEKGAQPEWPLVVEHDDGIRPAGPPDECFYCGQKIGQPHQRDCVVVTKRVRVRYVIEVEIDQPHNWTFENTLFHRNEGSWCANNVVGELEEVVAKGPNCLCDSFSCEYVGVVDDTPRRKVRDADGTPSDPAPSGAPA